MILKLVPKVGERISKVVSVSNESLLREANDLLNFCDEDAVEV
jgi:hypothetical protein